MKDGRFRAQRLSLTPKFEEGIQFVSEARTTASRFKTSERRLK